MAIKKKKAVKKKAIKLGARTAKMLKDSETVADAIEQPKPNSNAEIRAKQPANDTPSMMPAYRSAGKECDCKELLKANRKAVV